MGASMETIPVGEFKSKCLGLIEEILETGQLFGILKDGIGVIEVSLDNGNFW